MDFCWTSRYYWGLIKIENLPDDDYKYDEKKLVLKGKFHKYTIGDKIKVKLVNVSLTTRRIGFELTGIDRYYFIFKILILSSKGAIYGKYRK